MNWTKSKVNAIGQLLEGLLKMNYPLLNDKTDVSKNYSGVFRVIRTIVVVGIIVAGALFMNRNYFYVSLVLAFVVWFLLDYYGRRLLSDWTSDRNVHGSVDLEKNFISLSVNKEKFEFSISDVKSMILFSDHYKGYSANHADLTRNGNSLLYIEFKNSSSKLIKFNVPGKEHHLYLIELSESYSESMEFFKEYPINMIDTILERKNHNLERHKNYHAHFLSFISTHRDTFKNPTELNFDQLIAMYVTGNLTTSDLPRIGVAGLQQGLESESLVILAGISEKDNAFEIQHYFDIALEELQIELPNKRTAAIELALFYAQEIVVGRMDSIEGTFKIINDCLGSYDFRSETKNHIMDSIGFEKAIGLFYSYDDLKHADHAWSRTKTNEQLEEEIKLEIVAELKDWIEKTNGARFENS